MRHGPSDAIYDLVLINRWILDRYKEDRRDLLAATGELSAHDFIENLDLYIAILDHALSRLVDQ